MVSTLNLQDFIQTLDSWGLTDVALPFLLIFTIMFAILQKTKILGEGKKNLNVVIAIIVALLVVVPHVTGRFPPNADPVLIINNSLPSISIIIVAVIFLLILIGVFGQESVFLGMTMPGWIAMFSIAAIVVIFGGSAGWWGDGVTNWLESVFGSDAVSVVIMILVFGVIIAFITGEKKAESPWKKAGIDFEKLFGKK